MAISRLPKHLVEWFNAHWAPETGAIDGLDVAFLARIIAEHQPKTVVEIGVASGLSTAVISTLMSGAGGGRLDSFDLVETFYADPSKPVGFLLNEAPPHPGVTVSLHTGHTSVDVATKVDVPIDLCFIDAGHRHPWPLIDTLAILPLMRPGGIIVHHDLKMFLAPAGKPWATGPKIVLDHVPPPLRMLPGTAEEPTVRENLKCRSISENIFAIRMPDSPRTLGAKIAEGLYLNWDRDTPSLRGNGFSDRFLALIEQHYGPKVRRAVDVSLARYDPERPPIEPKAPMAARPGRSILGRLARR